MIIDKNILEETRQIVKTYGIDKEGLLVGAIAASIQVREEKLKEQKKDLGTFANGIIKLY